MTQMNLSMKEKQTHGCQGGGQWGGMDWEFGISRCKLLYIEWTTESYCIAQGTIFNIL